jgi:hypothetical protein
LRDAGLLVEVEKRQVRATVQTFYVLSENTIAS